MLLEAVVRTEDTMLDLSAELEAADSKIIKMAAIEMMTSTITREVLPVDVGEVAAADLEAVVCEVDLVEAVEVDSEEIKKPKPIPTKYFNTGPEPDIWQSDIW